MEMIDIEDAENEPTSDERAEREEMTRYFLEADRTGYRDKALRWQNILAKRQATIANKPAKGSRRRAASSKPARPRYVPHPNSPCSMSRFFCGVTT